VRLCITAKGPSLGDDIDLSFGRAAYFLFHDPKTGELHAIPNSPGAHGAGVQAARIVAENGAKTVITGSVGPNAYRGLVAAGAEIYVGAEGTVADAIAAYKEGKLPRADGPSGRGHGR